MTVKDLERIFKALANRRRLAIIAFLKQKDEASVSEIAHAIHLSFTATSKHLGILAAIDMVDREQRSLHMFYSLVPDQSSSVKRIISII